MPCHLYIVLLTIQIVRKQLHNFKREASVVQLSQQPNHQIFLLCFTANHAFNITKCRHNVNVTFIVQYRPFQRLLYYSSCFKTVLIPQ